MLLYLVLLYSHCFNIQLAFTIRPLLSYILVLQSVCLELEVDDVEKAQSRVQQLVMDSEALPHLKQVSLFMFYILGLLSKCCVVIIII